MAKTGGLLDSFSLDDGDDFFGSDSTTTKNKDTEEVIKEVENAELDDFSDDFPTDNSKGKVAKVEDKRVEKKEEKKSAKEEKEEENEIDDEEWFEDDKPTKKAPTKSKITESSSNLDEGKETKSKEVKEEKEEAKEETDEDFFTNLATDLKEKGIFTNVELPKDGKITEDKFFELQDQELEARIDETFQSLFEDVGEEGAKFLKYVKDGGNPNSFITLKANSFKLDELDVEDEKQVDKTLRYYISVFDKMEDEELEDRIKWLNDNSKSKAYAAKYFKTIKNNEKEIENLIIKEQAQDAKDKIERAKTFNDSLREVISKTEKVGSFSIDKSEHKELDNYITKPTVKIGKNRFVPEFQAKLEKTLQAKTKEDKQNLLVLAKLFKDNFKLEDLETDTETKVTTRTKSRLLQGKNNIKNNSSGGHTRRSLADFMD